MTPRLLSILAVATVVAVGAAGYAVMQDQGFETVAENTAVFPQLREKLNDVAQVKIVTDTRQMTLVRKDNDWSMVESDGYPAEVKNIQKVLIGLADLVYAEAKTRKPELYAKLDLREPSVKEARGRHVSVFAADGSKLADVILGKTRYNMPGTTRDGIYLRFPEDPQAWLAVGQLEASRAPGDWLQTKIVSIEPKTVQRATFRHPDGEELTVEKASPMDEKFQLLGLPADRKLKFASDPNNMALVLEDLELEDVRKASHFDFSADNTLTADFQTFDGMTVTVRMIELKSPAGDNEEEQVDAWVQLSAQADKPDVAARAREITAHTAGWAFKIPAYKASRLNKRLAEISEDQKSGS
ncbi:MAG: DUF4340 domain-containing protein [Rhodospirillales bacterium]|nr:DUF4340 domain-containing protein [Rhodospirillales bacterium]